MTRVFQVRHNSRPVRLHAVQHILSLPRFIDTLHAASDAGGYVTIGYSLHEDEIDELSALILC